MVEYVAVVEKDVNGNEITSEEAVWRWVCHERKKRGLPPVELVNDMGADQHAQTMSARRSMYHAGRFAENVAVGQRSASHVMRTWMNSSGHRNNILNRRWTKLDVGHNGRYWCQRFR